MIDFLVDKQYESIIISPSNKKFCNIDRKSKINICFNKICIVYLLCHGK